MNNDPKGDWASLSIACEDDVRQTMDVIDERIRELLADASEHLFGMKCTPEMIA